MTWQDSLLPGDFGPTAFELAEEAVSAARFPLPWQLLRNLQNPDKIDPSKLPILAWALSVDIWDPEWPVEKKRNVVRRAIRDHQLKGTIAGVRRYLEIVEASLVSYRAPPQSVFLTRSLTTAEYNAYLESMPQLRVYLRSRPGVAGAEAFADVDFADDAFLQLDAGWLLYGRFPVLYDRGVSKPLKVATQVVTSAGRVGVRQERIIIPGVGGPSMIGADFVGATFAGADVKAPAIYTVSIDQAYTERSAALAYSTLSPGLDPIDVRSRRMSDHGNIGAGACIGDFAGEFFVVKDEAPFLIYDVIYLLDPSRAAPLIDGLSFVGHSRLSMAPFTFEAQIRARSIASSLRAFEGQFIGSSYLRPENHRKIDAAMDAVALAKGYRDKGLATFETTRARRLGDGIPLDGSYTLRSNVSATL